MTDHTVERWLPVPGYEGYYDVSDQGRVRSLRHRWGTRPIPIILKDQPTPCGYRSLRLCRDGIGVTRPVQWIVTRAFYGERPDGMEVRHLNGDPTDNRLANLRYGTHGQNVKDTVRHGNHIWANRTHCPVGHEYNDENTYVNPAGRRECIPCRREAKRRYRARRKAAGLPRI